MDQIYTLLMGTLEARTKVLLKMNVPAEALEAVMAMLPAMKAPTVSELSGRWRIRDRDGRREVTSQHPHPGAEGRRRLGRDRAGALEDRPLRSAAASLASSDGMEAMRCRPETRGLGKVTAFDEDRGSETIIADDGSELGFPLHRPSSGVSGASLRGPGSRSSTVPGALGLLEATGVTLVTLSAQELPSGQNGD